MEVVASLSQGRTAAAQCGLFTHKSVSVIFEPPCINMIFTSIPPFIFLDFSDTYTFYFFMRRMYLANFIVLHFVIPIIFVKNVNYLISHSVSSSYFEVLYRTLFPTASIPTLPFA